MASFQKIFILVPTYNERESITKLVEAIIALKIPNLDIVIIDDNSPDGTGDIADQLAHRLHPAIHVIHRNGKTGLGPAYSDGFRYALAQGADLIFEMDADLSHDPAHLSAFLSQAQQYDLVIGSRYVPGGGIVNWGFPRRLISWCGNLYARAVLGVPIRDLTSGFKCFRREVLRRIGIEKLSSIGYVFQIETTYKAYKAGFRITEIPIIFTEREHGASKFNFAIFIGAFYKVLMLRVSRGRES